MKKRRALLAVMLLLCAAAQAEKKKAGGRVYAVRELSLLGDFSDSDSKRLRERIYQALELHFAQQGDLLAPPEEVEKIYLSKPPLRECNTWRCGLELGDALKAQRIITLRIEPGGDPQSWRIRLGIFNAQAIAMEAKQDQCESCTADDLVTKGAVVSVLKDVINRDKQAALCTLKIDSDPTGADVSLDGQVVGVTPFERTVGAHNHLIVVSEKGYANFSQSLGCPAGGSQPMKVLLDKYSSQLGTPPEVKPKTPKPSSPVLHQALIGAGVAAVVVGIPLLGVGSALVSYNGKPGCDLMGDARQCSQRAATLSLGVGLSVPGAVLVLGGASMLIADVLLRRNTPASVSVAPWLSPSSAGLIVGGRL